MKNKTSLVILALCMIAITAVSAMALVPLVIYGKADFNGVLYNNAEITITDDRGNTWYAYTSNEGIYTIDASNLQRNDMTYVSSGDYLTLRVCPSDLTGCSKLIRVSNIPKEVNFGVAQEPTLKPEECPVCKVCEDCPVCPECEECDETSTAVIAALIAFLTGAVGVYYFKRKDALMPHGTYVRFGSNGPQHLHRGLKGYHDPKTSHRDVKERHPRGELDPTYEKDETGKYVYVG